ncbi:MAG: benzoate-CoA ligase family protein, partial [candidate division NC10 bacterium]
DGVAQTLLVDRSAGRGWLDASSPELDPYPSREDDIAFLLYSSGSTGKPKGVPHRHGDMPFSAETFGRQVLGVSSDDLVFSASKLPFAYGLGNSISFPFSAGASVVLYPGGCTPDQVLRLITTYRPSLFFAVPTLYNLLLRTFEGEIRFPSLRLAVSAGEPLPASTYHAWKTRTGVELLDGIGSTEALHIFISNRSGDVRPGSSGRPIPLFEAKIVDETDRPVATGQAGHLLIRGKSTAPCYWNRPEKTQETMLADGWLRTGDIYVEEDGYYTYQGRGDDMFKVEAQWLSPIRVEDALRDHPAVLECAVTSRKLEGLVRPVAYVVPVEGVTTGPAIARDLLRHVSAKLPAWMCPVQVVFCAEIPKTSTGKVQRFRLRQAASGDASSTDR